MPLLRNLLGSATGSNQSNNPQYEQQPQGRRARRQQRRQGGGLISGLVTSGTQIYQGSNGQHPQQQPQYYQGRDLQQNASAGLNASQGSSAAPIVGPDGRLYYPGPAPQPYGRGDYPLVDAQTQAGDAAEQRLRAEEYARGGDGGDAGVTRAPCLSSSPPTGPFAPPTEAPPRYSAPRQPDAFGGKDTSGLYTANLQEKN